MSTPQNTQNAWFLELWAKQPKHLSDLEKTLRIDSFACYEELLDITQKPVAADGINEKWFFDLSLYLNHIYRQLSSCIQNQEGDVHKFYLKTSAVTLYLMQVWKTRAYTAIERRLALQMLIKDRECLIEELRKSLKKGNQNEK